MPAATSRVLRDEAVAKGITINGLVILSDNPMSWNPDHTNPPGGLANYYRNNVIGGPSAFVMVAENFNSFGQAIVKKMIAEVAQAHEPWPLRAAGPLSASRRRAKASARTPRRFVCFASGIWAWFGATAPATKATQMSSMFAAYLPLGIFDRA